MNRPHIPRRLLLITATLAILITSTIVFITLQTPPPSTNMKTIVFDFDTASPTLTIDSATPFQQTKDNLTASFTSPNNPQAFAVTNQQTKGLQLSQFTGNYLYDQTPSRDILDIKFSRQLVDVKFTFATMEQKSDAIPIPSDIIITAYSNNKLVGSNETYGKFSADSYPQGKLTFFSGMPFDWIRISVPTQTTKTTQFLIDNITVLPVTKTG